MVRVITATIETGRLVLTPLDVSDAAAMVNVLSSTQLYEFIGGDAPSLEQLEARYRAQLAGPSDPDESWHNWIVRLVGTASDPPTPVGFVQATITGDAADVAWLIGVDWQGQGIARESAAALCAWLGDRGVERITAHVHPEHRASAAVAAACGLQLTDEIDEDGEQVWAM